METIEKIMHMVHMTIPCVDHSLILMIICHTVVSTMILIMKDMALDTTTLIIGKDTIHMIETAAIMGTIIIGTGGFTTQTEGV